MKTKYTLIIIPGLLLCLLSCKKDNGSINPGSIIGRWYENKLIIQQQTIGTGNIVSATYTGNAFDTTDYLQFNSDKTAVQSYSGSFGVKGKTVLKDGSGNAISGKGYFAVYDVKSSSLILQIGAIPECFNCALPRPDTLQILQLDANNLVLHGTPDTSSMYEIAAVTYYTKAH